MSYELVAEVLDHAPAALDPTERLVLVCIAEQCRGNSRVRDIPAEEIRRRTGLGERGLRHVCERLAAKKLQVRVALTVDRHNKPVYALTGKVCRWVLPPLPPPADCGCARCEGADPQVPLQTGEDSEGRTPDVGGRTPDGEGMPAGPGSPPKPSVSFPYAEGTVVDRETALAHIRAATAASSRRSEVGTPQPPHG